MHNWTHCYCYCCCLIAGGGRWVSPASSGWGGQGHLLLGGERAAAGSRAVHQDHQRLLAEAGEWGAAGTLSGSVRAA